MRNYDEVSVVSSLMKKSTINVDRGNKTITILKDSAELGNGSWGKIDFLVKYCKYHTCYSDTIGRKNRKAMEDDVEESISKLNIIDSVKLQFKK